MEAILALAPSDLGPQAIANALNGLSRLGLRASAAGTTSRATVVDRVLGHLDASIEAVGAAGGKGRGGGFMERFEPRHISMVVNGWARVQYAPPEASVQKLVQAAPLLSISRKPGSDASGYRPMSRMTPQDVGLVSLGVMRLSALSHWRGDGLSPSSTELVALTLRAGGRIPEAKWDLQALANALTAYSMFRSLPLAQRAPSARGAGEGGGHDGDGEAAVVNIVCEAILSRPPSVFVGREPELAAMVAALPACGATRSWRPLVWNRLAEATLALPVASTDSPAITSQQLTMLIDGFAASGFFDFLPPSTVSTPLGGSAAACRISGRALKDHLIALAGRLLDATDKGITSAGWLRDQTSNGMGASASLASLLSSMQVLGIAEMLLPACDAILIGNEAVIASGGDSGAELRLEDAAALLSVLGAEKAGSPHAELRRASWNRLLREEAAAWSWQALLMAIKADRVVKSPDLFAKICSVACVVADRGRPAAAPAPNQGERVGAGGAGGGGARLGGVVAILDYLVTSCTETYAAGPSVISQCEEARVGLLGMLGQWPLASWSPEVAAHFMQVVGEGYVPGSESEQALVKDLVARLALALLQGADSTGSWDSKHITAVARFLVLHHRWQGQHKSGGAFSTVRASDLRRALARRVSGLLEHGSLGQGQPLGEQAVVELSSGQMATVCSALASFSTRDDILDEGEHGPDSDDPLWRSQEALDSEEGSLDVDWKERAMEAMGAAAARLNVPSSAGDVSDMAMIMTALAKAGMLSPTSALRQDLVTKLAAAQALSPASFNAKSAARILHSLAIGLPRASGAGSSSSWTKAMREEAVLCGLLLCVLRQEATWDEVPVSSLGKTLSALARLYSASHFPHIPGAGRQSAGNEVVRRDVNTVVVALATSVLRRDDAEWRQRPWAIANVVYGVSALLPCVVGVIGPVPREAAVRAQARDSSASVGPVSGVATAMSGRGVGLSEITISELDIEDQVLGKMARVIGEHEKAELACMGSRALRDLSAAFASAVNAPSSGLVPGVAQPTATTVATVVGLLCDAAALVPEDGKYASDTGSSGGSDYQVSWGWSTIDAALTLRHGAAVVEALDSLLLSSASSRASVIALGDVTLRQFEMQQRLPRVRLSEAAALTDVFVTMLSEMPEPVATSMAGKDWLQRVLDAFLDVPHASLEASVGGVAQMLAALCQAQRLGLVAPKTATRTRERLSVALLSLLQPDALQPVSYTSKSSPSLEQPVLNAASLEDGSAKASQDWVQDDGQKRSGGAVEEGEKRDKKMGEGLSERGQLKLLENLSSALQSLRFLAMLSRPGDEDESSLHLSQEGDIALVCDVVMARAAQLVSVRRSNGMTRGGKIARGGALKRVGSESELRSTVKLLRFVAGTLADSGLASSKQGRRRDKLKLYGRELIVRIQHFDSASANGVVVADMLEAAQAAGATTPSLLSWVARSLAEMPTDSWCNGGRWGRGGGASLSRILASIITLQNRLLRRFPRHQRLVLLPRDKEAQAILAAVGKVRTALAGVILALPVEALSAKSVGLLAFGLSRSAGIHSKLLGVSSDETMRAAVHHLADVSASKLLNEVVDPGGRVEIVVEGDGLVDVVGITRPSSDAPSQAPPAGPSRTPAPALAVSGQWEYTTRDCVLLAGAMMKAGISGHAAWPLLASHVGKSTRRQQALGLQEASYLADALVWEVRVGKTPLVAGSLGDLEPALAQSLLSSLRCGISRESAYPVALLLSALGSMSSIVSSATAISSRQEPVPDDSPSGSGQKPSSSGGSEPAAGGPDSASRLADGVTTIPPSSDPTQSAELREQVQRAAREAVMRLPVDDVSTQALCVLLAAFSRAGSYDGALLERLALGVLARAERGEASIAHMASVLSSLANCNMVWVDAALTEDVFMGLSGALVGLSPTSFNIQQIAVIASAFAKAKIFDSALFEHLSRAVQWRGRPSSQFTVQVAIPFLSLSVLRPSASCALRVLYRGDTGWCWPQP